MNRCGRKGILLSQASQNHQLVVITQSTDVTQRKVRSFAASLGAEGHLFLRMGDVLTNLVARSEGRELYAPRTLFLVDECLLSPGVLKTLRGAGKVAAIHSKNSVQTVHPFADLKDLDLVIHCSMLAAIESPIVRLAVSSSLLQTDFLAFKKLLRWGHWTSQLVNHSKDQVNQGIQHVLKELKLSGEPRRVMEMGAHFLQVASDDYGLDLQHVEFAADGLVTAVIAKASPIEPSFVKDLSRDLMSYGFPTAVVNKSSDCQLEFAFFSVIQSLWGSDKGISERLLKEHILIINCEDEKKSESKKQKAV